MQHAIYTRDRAELVVGAAAVVDYLAAAPDGLVIVLTDDGKFRVRDEDDVEVDDLTIACADDVLGFDRYDVAAALVDRALDAARDWTPPPTGVGLGLEYVEHIRYAYVGDGARRTVLWSTLPEYDADGHCVVRLDPDVPPIRIGPCECAKCGATVWPRVHVYDGWPREEWLECRAEDLVQEATWQLRAQAERLRPGMHAAHVDSREPTVGAPDREGPGQLGTNTH
jgi:hypothetical protein